MTDSEKLEELRKAFKLAVLCVCDGEPASLAAIFPPDSTADAVIQELETHVASFDDNVILEDYFKEALKL
ncbi:hypothetical protein KAR91_79580 [Candidatus Pacearchaeota archaeon]|nr:hypothetical protein [Candidatus Pacearchaeota archaeon]